MFHRDKTNDKDVGRPVFVSDSDDLGLEAQKAIADGTYTPRVIWKIPMAYKSEFLRDAIKAKRDLGAEPSKAIQAFYPDPMIATKRVNLEREAPWDDDFKQFKKWFRCENKNYPRFVHVDLAAKKDAVGFAMGYRSGYMEKYGESKPKVFIDLMIRIEAPKGGEISFSDVRKIIYELKELGFPIAQVTYDGWQSIDSIQILKSQGINADTLSVDRSMAPHDTLKSCLIDDRIDYYRYKTIVNRGQPDEKKIAIFEEEIQSLELVDGKKVDHAAKSSKDVADAVAGVVYWCCQDEIQATANPGISLI